MKTKQLKLIVITLFIGLILSACKNNADKKTNSYVQEKIKGEHE